MEFTESDLEKLSVVYWEIEKRGEAWEGHAKAVSRIYYACEAMLNEKGVIDEAARALVMQNGDADDVLVEEDTTKYRPKIEHRARVH